MVIDLAGADGNAYALLGYAQRFASQLNLDGDSIGADMKSGDYGHLLNVFNREFGSVVTLKFGGVTLTDVEDIGSFVDNLIKNPVRDNYEAETENDAEWDKHWAGDAAQ